jgi:hypothetical protein
MTTVRIVSIAYDIGFETGAGLGRQPVAELDRLFHEILDSWLSEGDILEDIIDEDDKFGLFCESALRGLREGAMIGA